MMAEEKKKQIFLMRHGDTGLSGRYIGVSDVSLSEAGAVQLAGIAPVIGGMNFDLVLVSPFQRCLQSLEILGLAGEVEPLLREVDFGLWEGKDFAEVSADYPELVVQWVEDENFAFPEGESLPSFRSRMELVAERLHGEECSSIFILAHGGVLRALICKLLNLPADNYLLFDVAPGHLTEISLYPQGGVLKRFNHSGEW